MFLIDAHCDTLLQLLNKGGELKKNNLQIDVESMAKSRLDYLQFFALFESPSIKGDKAVEDVNKMIDIYDVQTKENGIKNILSKSDLDFTGLASLLSIEGAYFFNGEVNKIHEYYKKGVRCISLTWNPDNAFSGGIVGESQKGLSRKGKKLIKEANNLGMVVDVSHISDKGFYDVLEKTTQPIIASHSNARALCSHVRNLDNDMLKALEKNGGVTGINMFSLFLSDLGTANISDVIRHIEHIASITSIDCVGIGTDFDGIPKESSAIANPHGLLEIFEELARLNYTQNDIEKVAGLNYIRILKNVLK